MKRDGGNRDGGNNNRNNRDHPGNKGGGKRDRDREGDRDNHNRRDDRGKGRRDDDRKFIGNNNSDKTALQRWLQGRSECIGCWFEGIDPPRRSASTPNVTLVIIANKSSSSAEDVGFMLAQSRLGAKKKDREKECQNELMPMLDAFPLDDPKAWFQLPDASSTKKEVDAADLERLGELVQSRVSGTTVELPEPYACVLVCGVPINNDGAHSGEPENQIIDRFEPGFGEYFREARRVSGLVRKQWFFATVTLRAEGGERPLSLGMGLATDPMLAKVRAFHAAEQRAHLLTEAIVVKTTGVKDEVPAASEA